MPNFVYPRVISIFRTSIVKTIADGLHEEEVTIAEGIDASIQLKRARPVSPAIHPGPTQSADSVPEWIILFRGDRDLVEKSDKIVDDLGVAYMVEAPYWNSLGWNLEARLYHP